MHTPRQTYSYYGYKITHFTIDEWAELSIKHQEQNPNYCYPIHMPYASKLEEIYPNEEKEFTEKEHKENIDFLKKLQEDLYYVWSHRQREQSGMGHLVKDYKTYYQIE